MQFFLNPLMLAGLAGVGLPIVAHLLSRRKYDVVQWGAMQFLNPSRKTRRKLKLEELLLLLIRIAAIAALAFAAARPWINSGFLTGYRSAGSRDIVLVVDGSNSMGRNDGLGTVHRRALRLAEQLLDSLGPGDSIAVVDARDLPVSVVESPLQDQELVREQLRDLPDPAGAADLQRACEEAIGILGRSSAGSREVVVLTDRQRAGWNPGDAAAWKRFDDVLTFPSVRPGVWVVDVTDGLEPLRRNVSVGAVELARDLTVPGFPVGLQVPIQNAGEVAVTVPIQILIDGQRVKAMDDSVTIPPHAHTTFTRHVQFESVGTHLITVRVVASDDSITVDNESHAALQVASAIPALLVHSSDRSQGSRPSTFFARLALTAPENETPWIQAQTVAANALTASMLQSVAVVVLSDVTSLSQPQSQALSDFVQRGNGILISVATDTTVDSFEETYIGNGLWPRPGLNRIRQVDPDAATPVTIAPYSLESSWLNRFRERKGASLLRASFRRWWSLQQPGAAESVQMAADGAAEPADGNTATARSDESQSPEDRDEPLTPAERGVLPEAAIPLARLTTGDPVLLQSRLGQGTVMLLTSGLDTDMNNLPAMPDYVPFLHEAIFQMASSGVTRNVPFGQPILTVIDAGSDRNAAENAPEWTFLGPQKQTREAQVQPHPSGWQAQLQSPRVPGDYRLVRSDSQELLDRFVVNYDHREDDPAELTPQEQAQLAADDRLQFVPSVDQLTRQMYGDESRTELWAALLWFFLLLLSVEVWLTRRLVLRGHAETQPVTDSAGLQTPAADFGN